MNWAAITWLVLLLIFLIVEGVCAIHLVSIWFAAGALTAMFVSFLGGELWLQITVFLVISVALLLALWPVTRKFLNPKLSKTNLDAIVGSSGVVTAGIDNLSAQGTVKLGAMEWTARSTTGAPIETGTVVRVDRIEGVKVFVTPVIVKKDVNEEVKAEV